MNELRKGKWGREREHWEQMGYENSENIHPNNLIEQFTTRKAMPIHFLVQFTSLAKRHEKRFTLILIVYIFFNGFLNKGLK